MGATISFPDGFEDTPFKIYLQKIEVLGINYIPVLHQPQLFWQLFCIKEMNIGTVQAHVQPGQFDACWLES